MTGDDVIINVLAKYNSEIEAKARIDAVALRELAAAQKASIIDGGTSSPFVGAAEPIQRTATATREAGVAAHNAEHEYAGLGETLRVGGQRVGYFGEQMSLAKDGMLLFGAAAAGFAAKDAIDFEQHIQTIGGNTGQTAAQLKVMREEVLTLGSQMPLALNDIADGFEKASNMMYTGKDRLDLVTVAAKAAVATGGNLTDMVNLLGTSMRNAHEPIANASTDMSMFMRGAAEGNVRLPDLANNFQKVNVLLSSMGQPLSEQIAAMSTLTRATHDASLSQTELVGAASHILNPTKQMITLMEELRQKTGVDLVKAFSEAASGQITLSQLFGLARQATQGNTAELDKLFGGIRGGQAAITLADQHWADYNKTLGDVRSSHSLLGSEFAAMMDTTAAKLKVAENRFSEFADEAGQKVVPVLGKVAGDFEQVAEAVSDVLGPIGSLLKDNPGLAKGIGDVSAKVLEGVIAWKALKLGISFAGDAQALGTALYGAGTAASVSGDEASASAIKYEALGRAIKAATIIGLAWTAAEVANDFSHSQNEGAIHKLAQAYADGTISATKYQQILQLIPPSQRDEVTALVEQDKAQRSTRDGIDGATASLAKQQGQLKLTADAWDRVSNSIGGVPWHSILGLSGGFSMSGTGSGPPPPAAPKTFDLQAAITDAQKGVQYWADVVEQDKRTSSASLGRDTAILDSHRETLIRLQKEEDTLTSVTKAVHQSLDPLSVASKAQSDAAKQIQSDYSLLGYALPGHIAAYEKATDTVNRLNLAVSNITANQQYAKFGASQQGVSNDIAELQHQSVLLGQSVSMTAEQKAVAQAQLQVEIDSKQVLLDTLKLQQIRAEHGNKQQIANAKATVTTDIYKLDESKGALSVSIRAEDLAKVEQHYKLVEQTDSNAIQELQHQSAMIGLNTSLSSEQKAVAQASLQVQIDQRQIALDTAKLMGVLADPNHTASDVAAARGQLSQDSGKLQEDQASLRNAKATDEATRAIQKWTRETSEHSQKADEAMDALALGIRNHDTPAQLEKLALAAANAQSLVNGDGTAHQKAADMVTKLLDPGIKLAGVFKQIADSGQSAADWLTKNFGQQGSQHTFGFGGFGVTGSQLEHANDPKTPPVTQTDINADFALKDLSKAATDNTAAFQAGTIDQTQYIQNLKQINTGTDAWNQKLIAADVKMGDWTGALALAKPLFDSGVMSFSDFVTIQKGANAATAAQTQKDWDAAFAAGDLATKSSMLSQLFGGLVSRASTVAGAQSSVDNARLGVIAANSDVQVGLLQSLLTETQDLSSIASAHQGVQTAIFTGELAKINDGVNLMQVIASGQQAQQATLQAIQQDAQKGDAQKLGLDQRLLAAQQQAGRDAITVATLQMEADQANARMQLKVSQDGEKMAIDKLAVDRINDANAAKLSLDKLAIAKDTYNSSVAQQKLTLDTMPILAEIAANTSPDGTTVNDYGAMVKADLAGILGLQNQASADQTTQANDQAGANQDSASGNLLLGNDQSQTNADSNAALQTQQLGELEIAKAKAKEAGDNLMVQTLQAAISALSSLTNAVTGNSGDVAALQAKIKDLNGLLKQQNLPLNRRPGGGGSTLRNAFGQTGASAAVNR